MGVHITILPPTPRRYRSEIDMKCPRCGNDNPEDSRFCKVCGTSLGAYLASSSTPQGMVSFPDAIRLGFQHYFDFRSRSTRAEYWWWLLFVILTQQTLNVVNIRIGILFGLAVLIPGLALGTRRLHDINKSGWYLFD